MAISWDKNNHSQKQFQKKSYQGRGMPEQPHTAISDPKRFFLKKRQPRRAAISEKGVWMSFLHLRIQQGKCRIQNFPQTQCRKNAGWTEKIVTFRYQGFRVL